MRKKKMLSRVFVFALLTGMTMSCQNLEDDEHYKLPSWSKGNAYEVMQGEGNYNIFLRGLELTGNDGIVAGKSLVTVAAPDDDAFTAFLREKGYGSIDEMYKEKPQYVNNLIGIHLMYYGFDWDKLVNFRPTDGDAATEAQKAVGAGYYYKHRTHCQDAIEVVKDENVTREVYHYERFLPVFSTKLFETKGIDAAVNYNYFYPNTPWYSTNNSGDGFNIANAAVSNTENIITDNGYLYKVDRVVEPLLTIYDELRENKDYSKFLGIYDEYLQYQIALEETNLALGRNVYVRTHGSLPNIACEWPYGASYIFMQELEKTGYNIFAPTNLALDNFFKSYWSKEQGYGSLDELDPLIKQYFINQMFSEDKFIIFPEEIEKGTVKTSLGTNVNFDPYSIAQNRRKICCNGVLYGMDEMTAPAVFSSVVAPVFRDTTYNCYLYCVSSSGLVSSLAADNSQFVSLIPSNKQFEKAEPTMRLLKVENGRQLQVWSDEAGQYSELGNNARLAFVNMHTTDAVAELKTTGTQVITPYTPFNYWYLKDGKITTNALFNELLTIDYNKDPFVAFHELTQNDGSSWSNGKAYSYDAESIFKAESENRMLHMLAVGNDSRYEYYYFSQLAKLAGMQASNSLYGQVLYLGGESDSKYIVFIPTNEVLKEHLKELPGCSNLSLNADGSIKGTLSATNKALLANYLRSYVISNDKNQITDYPFIGSSCKGTFVNNDLSNLTIMDNGTSLSVRLNDGEVVNVSSKYSYFPFAYPDGCIHFLDGLLK